jgi:hypothetical protein
LAENRGWHYKGQGKKVKGEREKDDGRGKMGDRSLEVEKVGG